MSNRFNFQGLTPLTATDPSDGKIEGIYGKFIAYEEVAVVEPAARLRRVYGVAYHEKGPLFYSFDLYNSGEPWVLYFINFDTKIREVFPPALIDRAP